jgi:hypothetical protein
MSEGQKRPSVGFWATTALVMLLIVYALSIGPATWLYWHCGMPMWLALTIHYVYGPLRWLAEKSEVSEALLLIYVSVWKDGF